MSPRTVGNDEERRALHAAATRERRARIRAEVEHARTLFDHRRIVARILAIPPRPVEPETFSCEPCECGGHPECPTCAA